MRDHGKILARYARYLSKPIKRFRNMIGSAKRRAVAKGIPFDGRLYELVPPAFCACCSRPLEYTVGRGIAGRRQSPSLDRFSNAEGYTLENTRVICYRCNEVKGDATAEELATVLAYMRR